MAPFSQIIDTNMNRYLTKETAIAFVYIPLSLNLVKEECRHARSEDDKVDTDDGEDDISEEWRLAEWVMSFFGDAVEDSTRSGFPPPPNPPHRHDNPISRRSL